MHTGIKFQDEVGNTRSASATHPFPVTGGAPGGVMEVQDVRSAFVEGKSYRTFKELSILAGAAYVIRATVSADLLLTGVEATIDAGTMHLDTVAAGTATGTWAETLPILRANNLTGAPTVPAGVVLTAGGDHSDGTVLDVVRLKADTNAGRATSVGGGIADHRGIAPGIYFFRLTNTGTETLVGTFKLRWEVQ